MEGELTSPFQRSLAFSSSLPPLLGLSSCDPGGIHPWIPPTIVPIVNLEGEPAVATFYSFIISCHGNEGIFKNRQASLSFGRMSSMAPDKGVQEHAAFAGIFKECQENGRGEERKMRLRKRLFGFLELILEIRDLCL